MDNENVVSQNRVCQLTNDEIRDNIIALRTNIEKIMSRLGRTDKVTLLGACKTMDKDVTDYVIDNGLLDALGDNKVQELLDKFDTRRILPWHFIGNLQTNKVKYIIDKVSLIHSVDRENLAKEIDKQAKKHDLMMNVLIEVNLGREGSKGGVYPENIDAFVECIRGYENINVVGLMSVMPNLDDKDKLSAYYDEFNAIFDRLKGVFGEQFTVKSIGMSGDYEVALEHGANLLRIGRLIFGDRRYI